MIKRILLSLAHLLSWISFTAASPVFSADASEVLTLRCEDEPLRNVLKTVSDQSGAGFVFQDDLVEGRTVTGSFDDLSLDHALERILSPLSISFKRIPSGPVVLYDSRTADRLIRGWVVDASNGNGLPFANIVQEGTATGTTSDTDGSFVLRNSHPDSCTIRVSYIGYHPEQIRLKDGVWPDSLRIAMQEQPIEALSVEVEGERIPDLRFSTDPGRIDFLPGRLDYIPSADGGFGRMLQMLPGADAAQDQAAVLNLDGSMDLETLVSLDGIPLYQPGAYYGFLSPLHPRMFEKATVWKTAYPAPYGDQTGGIVELTGNTVPGNRFNAGAGIDMFSSNAFIECPIAKGLKGFVGARRSHPDIISGAYYRPIFNRLLIHNANPYSWVVNEENGNAVRKYDFQDVAGKFTYASGGALRAGLTFFLKKEEYRYNCRTNDPADQDFGKYREKLENAGLSGNWEQKWNPRFRTKWTAAYLDYFPVSRVEYGLRIGSSNAYEDIRAQDGQNLQYRSIQLNNRYDSDSFSLDFGYELRVHEFHETVKTFDPSLVLLAPDGEPVFAYSHRSRIRNHIAFIQDRFSPIRGVDLILGLRAVVPQFRASSSGLTGYVIESTMVDWQIQDGPQKEMTFRTRIDPRLSARISFTGNLSVGLAYAACHQYIRRYPVHEPSTYPSLADQWSAMNDPGMFIASRPFVLDLHYRTDQYELRLDGRYTTYPGIGPSLRRGGSTRGVDWTARKTAGAWTGWISYRMNRSVFRDDSPEGRIVPAYLDRPHEIKAVSEHHLGSCLLSVTGVLASGIPYTVRESMTPELAPEYMWIGEEKAWFINEISGPLNALRLPAYRRLDVRITKKFENRLHLDWLLGLSILNVFDWENVYCRDDQFDSSNWQDGVLMTPTIIDIPSLGFTPMASVGVSLR